MSAKMAKLTIRITHISWRDGRPRFEPGPHLRADGWKGEDLRHGPVDRRGCKTGPWYTPEECLTWIKGREAEIAARRAEIEAAKARKKKVPLEPARRPVSLAITVADLFGAFFRDNPKMRGHAITDGKRQQNAAAPATIAFYRQQARTIETFDPVIWAAPVDALSGPIVFDLYERLWSKRGLNTARAAIAALSAAIGWGMKRGRVRLNSNPCRGLQMEQPEPRLRVLTPAEVRHLVAAADAIGRPEIGDSITLAIWTGQRQADRLAMVHAGLIDGRRVFRQQKTRAIVAIMDVPELAARLDTARERRRGWNTEPLEVIADERLQRPWERTNYSKAFAEVRAAAVAGIKDAGTGAWVLTPAATLADARDQDLRDTAVTWLARAGATIPEICAVTGHSLQSATQVLKHYLAAHVEMADSAIKKALVWIEGQ